MDQILAFVEKLLSFLGEGKAAEIVNMVKESGIFDVIVDFVKGLFA